MAPEQRWFAAVLEFAVRPPGSQAHTRTELSTRVVLATDLEAARNQALALGRSRERVRVDGEGRSVTWTFVDVVETRELDGPEDIGSALTAFHAALSDELAANPFRGRGSD